MVRFPTFHQESDTPQCINWLVDYFGVNIAQPKPGGFGLPTWSQVPIELMAPFVSAAVDAMADLADGKNQRLARGFEGKRELAPCVSPVRPTRGSAANPESPKSMSGCSPLLECRSPPLGLSSCKSFNCKVCLALASCSFKLFVVL